MRRRGGLHGAFAANRLFNLGIFQRGHFHRGRCGRYFLRFGRNGRANAASDHKFLGTLLTFDAATGQVSFAAKGGGAVRTGNFAGHFSVTCVKESSSLNSPSYLEMCVENPNGFKAIWNYCNRIKKNVNKIPVPGKDMPGVNTYGGEMVLLGANTGCKSATYQPGSASDGVKPPSLCRAGTNQFNPFLKTCPGNRVGRHLFVQDLSNTARYTSGIAVRCHDQEQMYLALIAETQASIVEKLTQDFRRECMGRRVFFRGHGYTCSRCRRLMWALRQRSPSGRRTCSS